VVATNEIAIPRWPGGGCLFHKPMEKQSTRSRGATVEPEGELVEVVVEMLSAHAPLVSAE